MIAKYDKSKCKVGMGLKGYTGCCCEYCMKYSSQRSEWVCSIIGDFNEEYEISVVRKTNRHGKSSWGWYDKDKILIAEGGGEDDEDENIKIKKELFKRQKELAKKMAKLLNAENY